MDLLKSFKLFEKKEDATLTNWYDFVIAYFVCLAAMWTVYIVIDNTFWFLPVFWYFCARPIETAIRNYYVTEVVPKRVFRYL